MTFGKEEIQYGYMLHAHTDGDVYVFLPGSNVLVTGDVFTVGTYPIMDWCTGGWIRGLKEGSRALLGLTDAQTRVVPGAGPIQTRNDVQLQTDMTSTMETRFLDMTRKGMTPKEMWATQPTKEFDARWGDPTLFIGNAYPGITNHVREIGGVV
jgi:glyoxylase-like metal-dependent hydrolase (beta-lactamase superfamily II)